MGKETGFLEHKRKTSEYRKVSERLKDYKAVEKPMSEPDIIKQASRCMDCGVPFCHGFGCPLANVIPEWNDLVYREKWQEALKLLLLTSDFPEFTARVCPALCEASCVLGINEEPVSIRQIELAVIEKGFEEGWVKPYKNIVKNGKKVAVVGSGPAGLSVANELNYKGYDVVVYEKAKYPGGLLRYGIPDFKLEKNVIERRIRLMEQQGIKFETNIDIGKDITLKYLKKKFDAVCIASGFRKPRDLPIDGRELGGVYFALDYLTEQNRIIGKEIKKRTIDAKGKNVVVIGGGDTGSDCIGTALRQGAVKVTQLEIMPKPLTTRPPSTPWPLWPNVLRTSSSQKEGCERLWSVLTTKINGKNGKVVNIECEKVEWDKQKDGRPFKFNSIPNSSFKIDADMVIIAMGFIEASDRKMLEEFGIKISNRGAIQRNSDGMTDIEGVFPVGDITNGASLVVRAISDGKEIANRVDSYLCKV